MSEFPKEAHVRAGGGEIHYRDWGGSGRAVALVHGLASNCRIWDFVAPILSRRFRVVALDQRGHGRSFKPDGGYDFASVIADLDAFSDAVGLSNAQSSPDIPGARTSPSSTPSPIRARRAAWFSWTAAQSKSRAEATGRWRTPSAKWRRPYGRAYPKPHSESASEPDGLR